MRTPRIDAACLIGGGLAIAIGGFAAWEASAYPLGTLNRMGPGYFPVALGGLLMALGGALGLSGLRWGKTAPAPLEPPNLRSLIFVLTGIAAFAALVRTAGLVPATVALVVLSSLSERRIRPLQVALLAIAVSLLCVLLFRVLIGLPLPAFRWL